MKAPLSLVSLVSIALSCPIAQHLSAQAFAVSTVDPPRNSRTAPTGGAITLNLTAAVNPATVTSSTVRVFGRWSGPVPGTFSFLSGNSTVQFHPSRPFFPGEAVTVMASSAVSGATSGSLIGGHTWSFWTRSAPGSGSFALAQTVNVRLPAEQGILAYGGYAGDLDADGSPDFSIACESAQDLRVFMSDGCGAFSLPTRTRFPPNTNPSPVEGADVNGDGILDVVIANVAGNSLTVLLGNGTGGFSSQLTYPSGITTRGVAVLDVEGDGDVDVVTANRGSSNLALHLNNGNGTFQAASTFEGGGDGETTIAAGDANGDGIADLFVGNYISSTATLLLGNGAGGFTVSGTQPIGMQPWNLAIGDFDGDGSLDMATANSGADDVSVVRGDGAGGLLAATTYPTATFPIGMDAGDIDGDGDTDLIASNNGGGSFKVFVNDGTGGLGTTFTLAATSAGSASYVVDYDRDGDMDIVGLDEVADQLSFFRQTGPSPPAVQPPSCSATLRVDNLANRGGFGGVAPHDVRIGTSFFAGVTAVPSTVHLIGLSTALEPGIATPAGVLNIDPVLAFFLVPSFTNAAGEDLIPIPVPLGSPQGASVALQSVVLDPAAALYFTLTNPERILLRP